MKKIILISLVLCLIVTVYAVSQWNIETVDSVGDVGYETSIALDSNDYPHISYEGGGNLKYAYWDGSSWNIENVDSVGYNPSLALDSNDYPHISYRKRLGTCCPYDYDLKYAYWDGSSWNIENVDSAGITAWRGISIALDSNDRPHISYGNWSDYTLNYAYWDGSSWNIENVGYIGYHAFGYFTSVAIDSNDRPHISYYYTQDETGSWTLDLRYAKRDGSSWNIENVDSVGYVGEFNSMVLDSNDYPHISYFDATHNYLKYAYWDGSSWQTETVDSANNVGWFTSIALDSDDKAHISYGIRFTGNLKYAFWNSTSWNIETVDDVGSVGYYNSIALDSNNKAHISYFDDTNKDLKYAIISADSDGDGIEDDEDECPNTSGEQIVYGCSCEQILALKPGEDTIENRQECSKGIIDVFTKTIGWAKDLFG